jgi:prepilin-type N-terminal cleavage/methylation domain-containing protein
MKKAFNLVELSIVLLIIGIVAGMVLKGRDLLEASYYKMEVRKVDKIRNAVFALMAKYNGNIYDSVIFEDNKSFGALNGTDNTTFDYVQFFDNGLLDNNSVAVQSADNWNVSLCIPNTGGNGYLIKKNENPTYICAYHAAFPLDIMCHLEVLMDDQHLYTGLGRISEELEVFKANFDNKSFNCDGVTPRFGTDALPGYGYLVYK